MSQALPSQSLPVGPGGADVTGIQFGLLTAMRVVEKTNLGNSWLLMCECGRHAVRRLAVLRAAVRDGREPMCSVCLSEMTSGMLIARAEAMASTYADLYAMIGSLYSEAAEERLSDLIRDDVASYLGFRPEPGLHPSSVPDQGSPPGRAQHSPLRRLIAGEGSFFECADCGRPFRAGLGCLGCAEPVCGVCAGAQSHPCWRRPMTLQEVGDALGLHRERVRQIEAAALRKLQRMLPRESLLESGTWERPPVGSRPNLPGVPESGLHCGAPVRASEDGKPYCASCGLLFDAATWQRPADPDPSTMRHCGRIPRCTAAGLLYCASCGKALGAGLDHVAADAVLRHLFPRSRARREALLPEAASWVRRNRRAVLIRCPATSQNRSVSSYVFATTAMLLYEERRAAAVVHAVGRHSEASSKAWVRDNLAPLRETAARGGTTLDRAALRLLGEDLPDGYDDRAFFPVGRRGIEPRSPALQAGAESPD